MVRCERRSRRPPLLKSNFWTPVRMRRRPFAISSSSADACYPPLHRKPGKLRFALRAGDLTVSENLR